MDEVDRRITEILEQEGRLPLAELSRRIGLSTVTVLKRMRRLEESGTITGYRAVLDPVKLGYPIRAFLGVKAAQASVPKLISLARSTPEVREAHHTTGDLTFVLTVLARDEGELRRIIATFSQHGTVTEARVLTMPVEKFRG